MTTPNRPLPGVSIHLSRRAALRLGAGSLAAALLAACNGKSSASGGGGQSGKPANTDKVARFLIGSWHVTITRDFKDGSGPSTPYAGTLNIRSDGWDISLGDGATPQAGDTAQALSDGNGNAKGSWQLTSGSLAITPTYGLGPIFGENGASWWSTLTASGLSGSPDNGRQISLPWNPTLSGNDPDMSAHPGTLAVHVKDHRNVTLVHTMNPTGDPNNPADATVTTIEAYKS